jgi:hypothetical protein
MGVVLVEFCPCAYVRFAFGFDAKEGKLTENLSSRPLPFVVAALGLIDETQAHVFALLHHVSAIHVVPFNCHPLVWRNIVKSLSIVVWRERAMDDVVAVEKGTS